MKAEAASKVALFGLLFVGASRAEALPIAVNLHQAGAQSLNLMSIFCDPSYDPTTGAVRAKEARCTFTQSLVSKPTADDIERELKELDKPETLNVAKELLKSCGQNKEPPANSTAGERRFYEQFRGACAAQDPGRVIAALRAFTRDVTAQTCRLRSTGGKTFTFRKLHDNAWETIDSGLGGTVVMTIWRPSPSSSWQYREVRAGDTTCNPDKDALCRRPSTLEYGYQGAPRMVCPLLQP